MTVSYNRLWKLMIDKGMNKTALRQAVGLSCATLAKLGKSEPISMETMLRICRVLDCDIGDIVEAKKDEGSVE